MKQMGLHGELGNVKGMHRYSVCLTDGLNIADCFTSIKKKDFLEEFLLLQRSMYGFDSWLPNGWRI